MITQKSKKQAKLIRKKQAFIKPFEINIQPWNGIITSQDPYTVPEDTAVWISGLPKLTGAIESVLSPETIYGHTTSIKDLISFRLGQNQYFGLLDGSNLRLYSNNFTQITSFNTTQTICDYAVQDNAHSWIVTRNFLLTFNGTTITNLTSLGINGDCICYWKGRIFIGKDRTITFSVPNPNPTGTPNPFNVSQGAGSITITLGNFSRILALIPKEDSIYIFTDSNIVSLIGTTISNDPNLWYVTEIAKEIGITGIRKYVVYEHSVYFHTPLGIYKIIATVPEKLDDAINNLTGNIDGISISYYQQIPYIVISTKHTLDETKNALYLYNLLNKRWYALDINATNLSHYGSKTYCIQNNKVLQLFAGNSYLPIQIKTKTYYNLENMYFNIKDIIVYGRGSSLYSSNMFTLAIEVIANRINFNTGGTNLVLRTSSEINLFFTYFLINFWTNVYRPKDEEQNASIFMRRTTQFDFTLNQASNSYSELINIKIRGTIGARYV